MSVAFKCVREDGTTITMDIPGEGHTVGEMLDEFRSFLLAIGYQTGSIDQYLGESEHK